MAQICTNKERLPIALVALALWLLAPWQVLADLGQEQGDDSTEDGATEEESADDSEATEGEQAPEPEADETEAQSEDEETGVESESEAPPLELPSPETIELDLEALGEMDPEKELQDGGILDEDAASVEAVESWTERKMDILELHGYLRVRPELYHKFYMRDGDDALYARPMVQQYPYEPAEGQPADPNTGEDCREADGSATACENSTLAGANMRFRLEPTLNISEQVWIKSQIDFLDNVQLGSSPRYYQQAAYDRDSKVETGRIYGWDMGPPQPSDMIVVRRAWGEVMTPFGQLRFGRMGDHWGLGMMHNAGNGLDQDFGDSVDRLMFATKINNLIIAPAFDFPNEGMSAVDASGRPFDVGQLDEAYQLVGILAYKHDAEDQLAMLRRGDWVVNTGLHFTYRWQTLSFETADPTQTETEDFQKEDYKFYPRHSWTVIPDFWFQFLKGTFHLELEAAFVFGKIANDDREQVDLDSAETLNLVQFGGILQADYGLLSDQLRIGLEFGIASGDRGVKSLRAPATFDQPNDQFNNRFSAFAFNPAYNTDLILYHNILGTVSQSYYFKPWLQYDFLRSAMGKKLGLRVDVLYSRAVFSESTISTSSANLGIEIDGNIYYQSEDGFYAGLKYGVLFPLGAFEGWVDSNNDGSLDSFDDDLTVPQTLQLLLGITY